MRHVRLVVAQHHLVVVLMVLCFEKCGVCSVMKSSWKLVALVAPAFDALQPLVVAFFERSARLQRKSRCVCLRMFRLSHFNIMAN